MPTRTISIDGRSWRVFPSGFVTQYNQDEFGLIFDIDPVSAQLATLAHQLRSHLLQHGRVLITQVAPGRTEACDVNGVPAHRADPTAAVPIDLCPHRLMNVAANARKPIRRSLR